MCYGGIAHPFVGFHSETFKHDEVDTVSDSVNSKDSGGPTARM